MAHTSCLAIQHRPGRRRFRRIQPWGMVVHTTGRGIVAKARRKLQSPSDSDIGDYVVEYYRKRSIVHYCITWEGVIHQLMPDNWRGAHVGIGRERDWRGILRNERKRYLSGAWEKDINNDISVRRWRNRWPGWKSPQHMYPTKSPNACYIGVELVPLDDATYTDDQYSALEVLLNDRAQAHHWPLYWKDSTRLVGHEDIDAYGRWDKHGGWDPGALRAKPRFDWHRVR